MAGPSTQAVEHKLKRCPFCGEPMFHWQGHLDYTYFGCGNPYQQDPSPGCGAIVSFRTATEPYGLRGAGAIKAFNRRKR